VSEQPHDASSLIRDLAAGMVFINGNVTSYPQLPFGGVRHSGRGRQLSGQGIREFCNIKSVWIRPG
jgi:succinate-semialdehyde dehydrogenase/glutarate-semialdehyde dehydrogenase